MEAFAPGVEVLEKEAFAAAQAAGASFSGMVTACQRGPDNLVTFLSNIEQFKTRYGIDDGNQGYVQAEAYFDQGGSGLYYGRAIGTGAAKAERILVTIDPSEEVVGTVTALADASSPTLPAKLTIVGHGLNTGDNVIVTGITGLTPPINGYYTITVIGVDQFTLDGTETTVFAGTENLGSSSVTKGEATAQLVASSYGAWANNSFLTIKKYVTAPNIANTPATKVIQFASLTGVEVGDVVQAIEADNEFTSIIVSINTATRDVTFFHATPGVAFTTAADISCTSTHKTKNTLASAYTSGDQLVMSSAATVSVGSLLLVITAARTIEALVTALNGNILTVTITRDEGDTSPIAAGSPVVSTNFTLTHIVDATATTFENMNLETTSLADYYVTRLDQSEYLRGVEITATPATFRSFIYPAVIESASMSGGLDGAAPTDQDYLGTNPTKTYTHGIKLFDSVENLPQFGVPDASVIVQKGADSYSGSRRDTFQVAETPLADDSTEEILSYRNITLNLASSYTALYTPWLKIADPSVTGAFREIPPTGRVLGMLSEVATRRGTFKPPANEALNSVEDVTFRITKDDHALLNAAGVNAILNVEGRGIRVMGARTLWPNADRKEYLNVRRILNATKLGLIRFGRTITFEPNDDVLWKRIQRAGERFLETLWKQGWFYPRNDRARAFFFSCDSTTNSESLRLAAKVRSVVGINPVLPGELILFELTLWDGGAAIAEL